MFDSHRGGVGAVRTVLCGALAWGVIAFWFTVTGESAQEGATHAEMCSGEASHATCQIERELGQELGNAARWRFFGDASGFSEALEKVADVGRVVSSRDPLPTQGEIAAARQWLEEMRERIPVWIDEFVETAESGGDFRNTNWVVLRSKCGEDLVAQDGTLEYFREGLNHLASGTPFDWDWARAGAAINDCMSQIEIVLTQIRRVADNLDEQVKHLELMIENLTAGKCDDERVVGAPLTPCETAHVHPDVARDYTEKTRRRKEARDKLRWTNYFARLILFPWWGTANALIAIGGLVDDIGPLDELGDGLQELGRNMVDPVREAGRRKAREWDETFSDRPWDGADAEPNPERESRLLERNFETVTYIGQPEGIQVRFYRDPTNTELWLYFGNDDDPTILATDDNTAVQPNEKGIVSWRDLQGDIVIEGGVRDVSDSNRIRFVGRASEGEIRFTFSEVNSRQYALTIEE